MHLVRVPLEEVVEVVALGGAKMEQRYFRPLLPASLHRMHGWRRAGDSAPGEMLVAVHASEVELRLIEATKGAEVIAACCDPDEGADLVAAVAAGDDEVARAELVACYREPAAEFEATLRREALVANVGKVLGCLVAALGLGAAACALGLDRRLVESALDAVARGFPIPSAILGALTLTYQDTFNRSDRNLSGDTGSDGLFTWGVSNTFGSTMKILSNQCTINGGTYGDGCWPSGYAATSAHVRVELTPITIYAGPAVRLGGSYTGYFTRHNSGGGAIKLFRLDSVSGSGTSVTQIGSDGAAYTAGHVIGLDVDGSALTVLDNGSTTTTATDATYASGVPGLWFSTGNAYGDDWAFYLDAATLPGIIPESLALAPLSGIH